MPPIVTLTANPAIDISTSTEQVLPTRKLRCTAARRDAGGGGINVARVVRRLGSEVSAIYPAGGSTGELLQRLVEREGVRSVVIAIAEETREDFTVLEQKSGNQYRFVLPGAPLAEREWRACIRALETMRELPRYIVASGSLPPGVPNDFYARVARLVKERGSKLVLDTSGQPLTTALEEGVYLIKPNRRELQEVTNHTLANEAAWLEASRKIIETGGAEAVALTLGDQGAMLVTRDAAWRGTAPDIHPISAVGAGDSFVGGMVRHLSNGPSIVDAFRYGIAAGSAAVLNDGTELCHASDVFRLYDEVALTRIVS